MKTLTKLSFLAACLTTALSVQAQSLLSDFSSSSGWGVSSTLLGTGSALTIDGGVGSYTSANTISFAAMRYNGVVGSYTSDWSVRMDVNFGAPSVIFTGGVAQFLNVGLMVTRSDITPSLGSGEPDFNGFLIESSLYHNGSGGYNRDMRPVVFAPGSAVDDDIRQADGPVNSGASTFSAVQISFNSVTKQLFASFDADGAANDYDFTAISSLTADASTWGMTGANTFSIYAYGVSGFDGDEEDTGPGPTISSADLVTIDNLYGSGLTAIPEPSTYAALAGALALGLAVWRRRQRATTV